MARFLKDLGTDVYHIEYRGMFSNHLMHGVVALVGLGAPDSKIASFARHYVRRLDPASGVSGDVHITEETLREFDGKRLHFLELVQFFSSQLQSLSIPGCDDTPLALLLRQHVPAILDGGIGGALFHPIIHIGYVLMQNSSGDFIASQRDVVDGLAYMVFSCRHPVGGRSSAEIAESMVKDLGLSSDTLQRQSESGIPDLSDVLITMVSDIRTDKAVREPMSQLTDLAALPQYDSMNPPSGYERKVAAVGDHGQEFLDSYTEKTLKSLHTRFNGDEGLGGENSQSFITFAMKAVIDGVIALYANSSSADDFYLLHFVTSAWALRTTLYYFDSIVVQVQILVAYLKAIFSTYVTLGMPAVVSKEQPATRLPDWNDIIKKTLESSDEHVLKLIYSCHEAEKVYGSPPSKLYKRAAAQKMSYLPWPAV